MHGIKPRTLSNGELKRYAAELLAEGPLPVEWATELLRRLNYYGMDNDNASTTDPRQLELPL